MENLKTGGDILWWAYEAIRFTLAPRTTYTPDFMVMTKDLELQVFEVKGIWLPTSRTKIKVANEKFPFHFFGVMWNKEEKQWKIEEF